MQAAVQLGIAPLVLDDLAGLAGILARAGEYGEAAALLGLVGAHPALLSDTLPILESCRETLQAHLSPAELQQALEQGEQMDLQQAIQHYAQKPAA